MLKTYAAAVVVTVALLWALWPALAHLSNGYEQGLCEGKGDVWSTTMDTCSPARKTYEQGLCDAGGGVWNAPTATCRRPAL